MKLLALIRRNTLELVRDPLTVGFGLGFPIVLLLLLSLIQANIPVELFVIDQLTPGIAVFGLSFISLFSAQLMARDRATSLMLRLYTAPLSGIDFILGYALPLLPIAALQMLICFVVALPLGVPLSPRILLTLLVLLPAALCFISIGLICGTLLNDRQVGGICGALLTNLSAWLSGTWFSLDLVGGWFKRIAYALPFARAVEAGRAALSGSYSQILPHLIIVLIWAVILMAAAVLIFMRSIRSDH